MFKSGECMIDLCLCEIELYFHFRAVCLLISKTTPEKSDVNRKWYYKKLRLLKRHRSKSNLEWKHNDLVAAVKMEFLRSKRKGARECLSAANNEFAICGNDVHFIDANHSSTKTERSVYVDFIRCPKSISDIDTQGRLFPYVIFNFRNHWCLVNNVIRNKIKHKSQILCSFV